MALEIEHKYLVHHDRWKTIRPSKSVMVKQAYLYSDPSKTIRVRVMDDKGFITIKGKSTGASRSEYEYEIPLEDALGMIRELANKVIEKTRHYIHHGEHVWEVDVFEGENEGLIVAEIELGSEEENYLVPDWVHENVTQDKRYANSNLLNTPFRTW
ncbi:MAG TPA: CYTH domain-containing protein [Bacteroidia bacterium]